MSSFLTLSRAVRTAVPTVLLSSIAYTFCGDSLFGLFTLAGRRLSKGQKVALNAFFLAIDTFCIVVGCLKIMSVCPLVGFALSSENADCYPIVACGFVFTLMTTWLDRARFALLQPDFKTTLIQRLFNASVIAAGWLGLVERDSFCIVDLAVVSIQRRIFPSWFSVPCQVVVLLLGIFAVASGGSRKPAAVAVLSCVGEILVRITESARHTKTKN